MAQSFPCACISMIRSHMRSMIVFTAVTAAKWSPVVFSPNTSKYVRSIENQGLSSNVNKKSCVKERC